MTLSPAEPPVSYPAPPRAHGWSVASWFGLFTTGPKTGTWHRFHKRTTMAPVIIDGCYVDVEWVGNTAYTVYFQMTPVSPLAGGDHYWLHEVERSVWVRARNETR